MRRLLFIAVVAAFVAAVAVPAGAVAAKTVPLTLDCGGRGSQTFNIILADASIVGFEEATGKPVIIHGVEGEFVEKIVVDGNVFAELVQPESFLRGKGKGLEVTECEAEDPTEVFSDTFPLDDEIAALIFDEFGVVLPEGDEVMLTGTFQGSALVQFPGR